MYSTYIASYYVKIKRRLISLMLMKLLVAGGEQVAVSLPIRGMGAKAFVIAGADIWICQKQWATFFWP